MTDQREPNSASDATAAAPVVSPALRRRLQQCFDHAAKLVQQEKYDSDYANTMLTECVLQDPGNLVYVEKFLENLQRKYDNNKKGARFTGFGGRGAFKKAVAKKEWLEVLKEGPALLKLNPWDVATLRPLAEACAALDLREVELRYLRNALDANPKDAEVNRHCAKSLQRMGQFDQAIACWHRVEEALKNDVEAPHMVAQLQIEKTRARAGYGDSSGSRGRPTTAANRPASPATGTEGSSSEHTATSSSKPKSHGSASLETTAPTARREVQLTPRQRLERAIAEDASDLDSYLQLAQLHLDEQRLPDAESVLKRALAVSGNDLKVHEKCEDVTIVRHRQQLAVAERLAAAEKTRESQELAAQLRQELNRIELEVYRGRSERYPRESAYKYQFGVRLKRASNFSAAVVQFSELIEGTPHVIPAALELGECYQMLKQYPLALQWYRQAVERDAGGEHPDIRKLALYRGGVLASALREMAVAEQLFSQLVILDQGYKDAVDRLDKLRQMRDKDGP